MAGPSKVQWSITAFAGLGLQASVWREYRDLVSAYPLIPAALSLRSAISDQRSAVVAGDRLSLSQLARVEDDSVAGLNRAGFNPSHIGIAFLDLNR